MYVDLSESYIINNGEKKPIFDKSLCADDPFYKSKYLLTIPAKTTKPVENYLYMGVLRDRTSYGGPKNTTYLSKKLPELMLGERKEYSYDESPYKYTISLVCSMDPDYSTKSEIKASLYVSEILGGQWDKMLNTIKMKDLSVDERALFFFGKNN